MYSTLVGTVSTYSVLCSLCSVLRAPCRIVGGVCVCVCVWGGGVLPTVPTLLEYSLEAQKSFNKREDHMGLSINNEDRSE